MGIYPNHSVAYMIKTAIAFITIVSSPECATRLIDSNYFNNRKYHWLDMSTINKLIDNPQLITTSDFDVCLTDSERLELQKHLDANPDVKEHGWYEVASIDCSYNWEL